MRTRLSVVSTKHIGFVFTSLIYGFILKTFPTIVSNIFYPPYLPFVIKFVIHYS